MICKQCRSFFSVTEEEAGTQTGCPECGSVQEASRTEAVSRCTQCGQELQYEIWMAGECVLCPACGGNTELGKQTASANEDYDSPVIPTPDAGTVNRGISQAEKLIKLIPKDIPGSHKLTFAMKYRKLFAWLAAAAAILLLMLSAMTVLPSYLPDFSGRNTAEESSAYALPGWRDAAEKSALPELEPYAVPGIEDFIAMHSSPPMMMQWPYLAGWAIWLAAGLIALRLIPAAESAGAGFFQIAALFAGPVSILVWLLVRITAGTLRLTGSFQMKKLAAFSFIPAPGGTVPPDTENAIQNFCRRLFKRALAQHCSGILFSPAGSTHEIILINSNAQTPYRTVDAAVSRNIFTWLKKLAALDAFETRAPQNGYFYITGRKNRKYFVSVSAVGMPGTGERILLNISRAVGAPETVGELPLPAQAMKKLAKVLNRKRGLVIISGGNTAARYKLTSIMLKYCRRKSGLTVWAGAGDEPELPGGIALLKISPREKITAEKLLTAMPDCRAAAITMVAGDQDVIPFAAKLASGKPVFLIMNQPDTAGVLSLCRRSGIQAADFADLIIIPRTLHCLCRCAEPAELSPDFRKIFAMLGLPDSNIRRKNGCLECVQTGFSQEITFYEAVSPAEILPPDANTAISDAMVTAYALVSGGIADPDEANNLFQTTGEVTND